MSETRPRGARRHVRPRAASPTCTLTRVLAAAAVLGSAVGVALVSAPTALASTGGSGYDGVFISEVETHGAGQSDTSLADGDWIELYNSSGSSVNLTGAILSDSENTHAYVIGTNSPSGTATIAAGGYQAYRVDSSANTGAANFSLGDVDAARLYAPGGTVGGTTADEFDWGHTPVHTWARDFDDPGFATDPQDVPWQASAAATPSGENVFTPGSDDISSVTLNEVNMNGGASGDWIELYNTSATTSANLAGAILSDSDDSHAYLIGTAAGDVTTLAPHGFAAYQVDDKDLDGNFGLSNADEARLFSDDTLDLYGEPDDPAAITHGTEPTPVDSTSWANAMVFTWGRATDGTGIFGATTGATEGESNADAPAAPSGSNLSGVVLNEVKTTGDTTHGDWIELYNTNASGSVDLSNAILSDANDAHVIRIDSGVSLGAGDYLAITTDTDTDNPALTDPNATGDFGLGDADEARLFTAGSLDLGSDAPVDSFAWSDHAPTSYGRDSYAHTNNAADWAETNNPTYEAANDFTGTTTHDLSWVQLNEVESTESAGEQIPSNDWVEMINTAPVSINVAGAVLSDSEDSDAITLSSSNTEVGSSFAGLSAGTTVPAGEFAVIKVDDKHVSGHFGLGSNDAIRLYEPSATPGTSIPIDHFEWTDHPAGSYQRQDSGLGGWGDCSPLTPGAANTSGSGCTPVS